MVRQLTLHHGRTDFHRSGIDWFKVAAAIAIGLCCLCAPCTLAQSVESKTNTEHVELDSSNPILIAQLPTPEISMMETKIQPGAMKIYRQAVQELHNEQEQAAEKDALRALKLDAKFADADALAATAALAQRQFNHAFAEAGDAVRIDANDEKAWVILATADNYLGRYADAVDALKHVQQQDRNTWQTAYQWSRAEAGQEHIAQTLEWASRAALTAPPEFAPLHLLRASAFSAVGEYARAADELEIYLQLLGTLAPERAVLSEEVLRLRKLSQKETTTQLSVGKEAKYRALNN